MIIVMEEAEVRLTGISYHLMTQQSSVAIRNHRRVLQLSKVLRPVVRFAGLTVSHVSLNMTTIVLK